jgi:toxin ParE1/3/4
VKVTFSPAARDDLLEIALHIAQDNPTRALSFADELEDKCTALGHAPGIGTARPELGDGVPMLPHCRYLIFYRHTQRSVRIERIMHSTQDIGADDLDTPPGGVGV